jgi:hypothetical protein
VHDQSDDCNRKKEFIVTILLIQYYPIKFPEIYHLTQHNLLIIILFWHSLALKPSSLTLRKIIRSKLETEAFWQWGNVSFDFYALKEIAFNLVSKV